MMSELVFERLPDDWEPPQDWYTEHQKRAAVNRRPHCCGCGRFLKASTLRYVNTDDLVGD
jgi:hypothetical protein